VTLYIVATSSKEVSGYSTGTVVCITFGTCSLEVKKANVLLFSSSSLSLSLISSLFYLIDLLDKIKKKLSHALFTLSLSTIPTKSAKSSAEYSSISEKISIEDIILIHF